MPPFSTTRSHEVNVYWCLYFVVRKASAFEDHDETLQMSTKRHYRCQRTVIVASLPPREYRNVNMIRPPSLTCTHIKICVQSIWITYTKYYNNSTKHLQLIKTGTVGYDSKCEIQFEQQESLTISEVLMNVPIKSRFMLICILRDSFTIHFRRTFIANGCGCAARCINIELLFFDSDFALGRTTFKIHPLLPQVNERTRQTLALLHVPGSTAMMHCLEPYTVAKPKWNIQLAIVTVAAPKKKRQSSRWDRPRMSAW